MEVVFLSLLTIITVVLIFRKKIPRYHSHWNILLDTHFSTMEFFDILKNKMIEAEVDGINYDLRNLKEGNFSFAKRKYLNIEFKEYSFLITAAPFGKNHFFISYWGQYNSKFIEQIIGSIPFIGEYLAKKLFDITYHKHDTCSSFLTLLDHCVKEAMEEITKSKGIDMPVINKPVMDDFFKR